MGAPEPALHEGHAPLALTQAQYGIWLGQQLDPASAAYLTAEAVDLHGPLDPAAFCDSAREVLLACDALHMRCHQAGDHVVQVLDSTPDMPVPCIDLRAQADPAAAAAAWMTEALAQPVDLARGPLCTTALLQLSERHHRWFLLVHHIALDGFGHALVAAEAARRYRERASASPAPRRVVPPARFPLVNVVEEDLRYQASPQAARDRAWWLDTLAGAGEPVSLAAPAAPARQVLRCRGELSATRWGTWRQAAADAGTDEAAWLLAGVAAWLHHRTGAGDLTLGLPVMNRLGSAALRLPCMAMNIVPLRVSVATGDSVGALARAVSGRLKALRPHQRYRYERLRADLRDSGGPSRPFGPVVNLMPFERPLDFGPGVHARSMPVSAGPVEDLSITLAPRGDVWQFDVDANPHAYTPGEVAAWRADLLGALDRLAAAPRESIGSVLSAARPALLSGGPLPGPAVPVLEAIVACARQHGPHPALSHDGRVMSYAQLLYAVQALAGHLAAQGVEEGTRVVVLLPRSMQAVTVLLSVLWAGGSYVPIDPDGPPARLAMVLADATPHLVITLKAHADALPSHVRCLCLDDNAAYEPPLPSPREVATDALAYVIYTSGSTGRPNGVMVGRAALALFIAAARERYAVTQTDRVLQFAPLHFDASVEEIFLSLTTGATLVLRTDAMVESMAVFSSACAAEVITLLDLPTAFWHEFAHAVSEGQAQVPPSVRLVVIGGEAALAERVARWRAAAPAGAVLLNTYGPTETTVICSTAVLAGPGAVDVRAAVPIGRPLAGVDLVVVDPRLQPVPQGVAGELCVVGGTLASGYLGQADRTAERFVALAALPGAPKGYRTGDQVRIDAQGELVFLGRRDDELKLSGHRIDPAEIEAALLSWPGVREAAVVPQPLPTGGVRLVAFVVAWPAPEAARLRSHLAERVAAVAVPSAFVALERLPRNANNKVDRKVLRHWPVASEAAAVPERPATAMEQAVMAVWRDVLGAASLSPQADFFSLGGKSLQAIQAANRLGVALRREVLVATLFRHPTVSDLARVLEEGAGHAAPPGTEGAEFAPLLTIQAGDGPVLFCLHPAEGLAWCYFGLSRALPGLPLCGVQAAGLTGEAPDTFDTMVDQALASVRARQPAGPYRLLGWSSGGGLAHALATRLQSAGERVELLALMDAYPAAAFAQRPAATRADAVEAVLDVIGAPPVDAAGRPLSEAAMRERLRRPDSALAHLPEPRMDHLIDTAWRTMTLYRGARHDRFDGDVLFFRATRRPPDAPDVTLWHEHVSGELTVVDVDSTHSGLCQPAPLAHVGRVLAGLLLLPASLEA